MKTLRQLDDAGPLIRDRVEFTSRTRETPYGTWTSMRGTIHDTGPRRHADRGYLPHEYRESFWHATYVAWSYDTPMAWWLERPAPGSTMDAVEAWLEGGQTGFWVMPSVSYSNTTANHQSIIAHAIDPGEVVRREESTWIANDGQSYSSGYDVRGNYTTEFRQLGWSYKHKYKNRGENADGPSVERHGY